MNVHELYINSVKKKLFMAHSWAFMNIHVKKELLKEAMRL